MECIKEGSSSALNSVRGMAIQLSAKTIKKIPYDTTTVPEGARIASLTQSITQPIINLARKLRK